MKSSTYVAHILETTDYLDHTQKVKDEILLKYGIEIEILEKHTTPFNFRIFKEVIENHILTKFGNKYPDGLKTVKRNEEIILYRQVFYYIAYHKGKSQRQLARLLQKCRTTVLYGIKRTQNLLDTKDSKLITVYNEVVNLYNNHSLTEEQLKHYEQNNTKMD
jgi:hypothetical protein